LIVGGGFGGVVAAESLAKRLGSEHEITLVSRSRKFLFYPALETLGIGFNALGILVLAEVLVALLVRPNRARDPISGAAYFVMLGVFAVMPWLVAERRVAR
jgi:hypothetical protein